MYDGTLMLKFCRASRPHHRTIQLMHDEHGPALTWTHRAGKLDSKKSRIALADVHKIIKGQQTEVFARQDGKYSDQVNVSFSVIYGEAYRSMDLLCFSPKDFDLWFNGLNNLLADTRRKNHIKAVARAAATAFARGSQAFSSTGHLTKLLADNQDGNSDDEIERMAASIIQRAWRMRVLHKRGADVPSDDEEEQEHVFPPAEAEHIDAEGDPNVLLVTVLQAGKGLRAMDRGQTSDPVVRLRVISQDLADQDTPKAIQWKTSVQHKTLTPIWDPPETFAFEVEHATAELELVMEDQDTFGTTSRHRFMGRVIIPLSAIGRNRCVTRWYKLLDQNGKMNRYKQRGKIQLRVHWCKLKTPLPNQLLVKVIDGKNLQAMDGFGDKASSDPIVILTCESRDGVQRRETQCIEKSLCPVWNENFVFSVSEDVTAELHLVIEDVDFLSISGNDFMGHVKIPVAGLWHQQEVYRRYTVRNKHDRAPHNKYGTLQVAMQWVYNPHVCTKRQQMARLDVTVVEARELKECDYSITSGEGSSDPYCVVRVGNETWRTDTIMKQLNPQWKAFFPEIPVTDITANAMFTVYDYDKRSKDDPIGRVIIPLYKLKDGVEHDSWYQLFPMQVQKKGYISDDSKYYPVIPGYNKGLKAPEKPLGFLRLRLFMQFHRKHLARPFGLLHPSNMLDEEFNGTEQLQPAKLKFNIKRLVHALAPFLYVKNKLGKLMAWEAPSETYVSLLFWYYACFMMRFWHLPALASCTCVYVGLLYGSDADQDLEVWHTDASAKAEVSDDEDTDTEDEKKSKQTTKKRVGIFNQLAEYRTVAAEVQNKFGVVASKAERLRNAFLWSDRVVSSIVLLALACGTMGATMVLYLVPIEICIFWFGVSKFMRVPMKHCLLKFKLARSPTGRIRKPSRPQRGQCFLRRIPDSLEIAHRQICKMQFAGRGSKEPFRVNLKNEGDLKSTPAKLLGTLQPINFVAARPELQHVKTLLVMLVLIMIVGAFRRFRNYILS